MGGAGEPGVKVVIISTQYVETDALSFKSVVQKLTGKDSTPAKKQRQIQPGNDLRREPAVLERVISFKDFDRMLMELPPLDELYSLYAE